MIELLYETNKQAFKIRCYRGLLNISYKNHVTNEEVRRKIQAAIGEYDELLAMVKTKTKVVLPCLAKTILQGIGNEKKKKRLTEEEMGRQY